MRNHFFKVNKHYQDACGGRWKVGSLHMVTLRRRNSNRCQCLDVLIIAQKASFFHDISDPNLSKDNKDRLCQEG